MAEGEDGGEILACLTDRTSGTVSAMNIKNKISSGSVMSVSMVDTHS